MTSLVGVLVAYDVSKRANYGIKTTKYFNGADTVSQCDMKIIEPKMDFNILSESLLKLNIIRDNSI